MREMERERAAGGYKARDRYRAEGKQTDRQRDIIIYPKRARNKYRTREKKKQTDRNPNNKSKTRHRLLFVTRRERRRETQHTASSVLRERSKEEGVCPFFPRVRWQCYQFVVVLLRFGDSSGNF